MKWFVLSLGLGIGVISQMASCSSPTSGTETSGTETSTEATTESTVADSGNNPPESTASEATPTDTTASGSVPTNADDLMKFLQEGKYKSWPKESKVHAATLGSPHGPVLVYVNEILDQSLKAGNSTHPVGAASIKELYQSDMTTLNGYAVMVKATAGSGGNTWYWYEKIGSNVVANSTGAVVCTGCHSPGKDFFRTEYPLK